MTFTVDDLVASFNTGGHIGQEAIDIANLQAQLAQTLAYAQQQQHHQHQQQQQQFASASHRLCNTPTTARTPTTSFGNWSAFEQQQHRARSRSASVVGEGGAMDTVNEDCEMDAADDEELAVEQLLAPSHNTQSLPSLSRRRTRGDSVFAQQQQHQQNCSPHLSLTQHRYHTQMNTDPMFISDSTSSPISSSYAASDPFFAAAAAESARQNQQAQAQSSFFAQIGRPSQHSPFFAAATTTTTTTTNTMVQGDSGNATPLPLQNQFNAAPWCVPTGTIDS